MNPNKLFAAPRFWKSIASVGGLPSGRELPSDRELSSDGESPAAAEIAFAGRSNAGKSSAINAVCGRRIARVGRVPGRTRMVNYFALGGGAFLLDLPGYGYAQGADAAQKQRWAKMIDACLARIAVLVLVADCRRGLTEADCRLLARFAALSPTGDPPPTGGLPPKSACHILLSKSDKLARAAASRALHSAEKIAADSGAQVSAQLFSALKKTGITQARQTIAAMLSNRIAPN